MKAKRSILKESSIIIAISVFLFIFVDLLLGWFYPKIYTPTKYGWSAIPDRKFIRTVQNTKDNYRKVSNQYFAYGFKRWPEKLEGQPRVLIIGDSFTQMKYVSNGEEWYAYLEKEFPDIAFFVFGGAGYGTLQEYMVLDDHFAEISPDAIIWQFCGNDYTNNYYELDRLNYPLNNHSVRPYWEDNSIVYRLPLPYPQLRKLSFSADRLLKIYDGKRWRDASNDLNEFRRRRDIKQSKLSLLEKEGLALHKSKAVHVTKILAKKIRMRAGKIPIYFINACNEVGKNERSLCEACDFRCIDFISDYMKGIEDNCGIQIKVENDGHWNYNGNKYAGEALAEYFKDNGGIFHSKQRMMAEGSQNEEIPTDESSNPKIRERCEPQFRSVPGVTSNSSLIIREETFELDGGCCVIGG